MHIAPVLATLSFLVIEEFIQCTPDPLLINEGIISPRQSLECKTNLKVLDKRECEQVEIALQYKSK